MLRAKLAGCGRRRRTTAAGCARGQVGSLMDASSGKAPRQPRSSSKSPTNWAARQSGSCMPSKRRLPGGPGFEVRCSGLLKQPPSGAPPWPGRCPRLKRCGGAISAKAKSPRPQGDSKRTFARSAIAHQLELDVLGKAWIFHAAAARLG